MVQLTVANGPLEGGRVAMYCGDSLPPHCVQICSANQHDIRVIQSFRGEASIEVDHPPIVTLKMDRGMCAVHPVINALHSSIVFVPMVPFIIMNPLNWELLLAQTFVAFCVPHLLSRWPTAARFAEVCAEDPLHPLHWRRALGAIAAPVPPTAAFVVKTKGSCGEVGTKCR